VAIMAHELDFEFNDGRVGYFEGTERPSASGVYRYMPYRSGSHYSLMIALRDGTCPRCSFTSHPAISFAVVRLVEYGILELADFVTESGDGEAELGRGAGC
jgi:hypothetical protein